MAGSGYTFTPIGVVRGGGEFPQQAPRQSVYARNEGFVELFPHRNFEQALEDLAGFARIWLVFVFDRNDAWKPKVFPPFGADRKVGVFATRAPYRPNPIGISAVELVKIEGLKVYIRNFDLLDGTPVLDIKPYIPEADSFPGSPAGWRDAVPHPARLLFTDEAASQLEKLRCAGGPDLADVARIQLTLHTLDPERQRLAETPEGESVLAYRTWRIAFVTAKDSVTVTGIFSGYTPAELAAPEDPYGDKAVHWRFAGK